MKLPERVLWDAYWSSPSKAAADALVVYYAPLCRVVAERRAKATGQVRQALDEEDLAQELVIELGVLIPRFDPARSADPTAWLAAKLRLHAICVQRDRWDFVGRNGRGKARYAGVRVLSAHDEDAHGRPYIAQIRARPASVEDIDRRDKEYRREVIGRLVLREDRWFALLRWWRGLSLEQIGRLAGGRSGAWAQLRQAPVRARLLRAMGRADLVDVRPVKKRYIHGGNVQGRAIAA